MYSSRINYCLIIIIYNYYLGYITACLFSVLVVKLFAFLKEIPVLQIRLRPRTTFVSMIRSSKRRIRWNKNP